MQKKIVLHRYLSGALVLTCAIMAMPCSTSASELSYTCSTPPLAVSFNVVDGHYNGTVNRGNLFLQKDIPIAPKVQWKAAKAEKFYTLLMLDFDGNAAGSWPDAVASGPNSPVRHWIIGNIPGAMLRRDGYIETSTDGRNKAVSVVQSYRAPQIPMVSDRYGVYLFEQLKQQDFASVTGSVVNFDHAKFIQENRLGEPKASNFFVAIYTSESPFSGKAFQGNDVSETWHHDLGKGKLRP